MKKRHAKRFFDGDSEHDNDFSPKSSIVLESSFKNDDSER